MGLLSLAVKAAKAGKAAKVAKVARAAEGLRGALPAAAERPARALATIASLVNPRSLLPSRLADAPAGVISRLVEPAPEASKLDMSTEARMARARQMGFDVENPLYVSTLGDVPAFAPYGRFRGHKGISGTSLTDNPELASRYLDRYGEVNYKGEPFSKQMMKVFIRPGEIGDYDSPIQSEYTLGAPLPENYNWPQSLEGIDTAVFPDAVSRKGPVRHLAPGAKNAIQGLEYILRDPTRVRSFTAAFDPEHSGSADLMRARGGLAVKKR